MRVLVTGSSGLIGRALCIELLRLGHTVDEYDLRPLPGRSEVGPARSRDIRDHEALRAAVERSDGIVHLAAISRCAPAEADPALTQSINVEGTRAVAEAVRDARPAPWLIFSSSREVYGEPRSIPVSEADPVQPKSVYGRSKVDAEESIRNVFGPTGGRVMTLRLTNIYGSPWDHPDRVVPAFLRAALRGSTLEVRGPYHIVDLLHLSDSVRAITASILLLQDSLPGIELLNVGSGSGVSLRQLADEAVACTQSRSGVREVDPDSWAPSRYVADIRRAQERLGWKPTMTLPAGLLDLSRAFAALPTVV